MINVRGLGMLVLVTLVAVLVAGCGSRDLGQVSGTVTLDGEPLPNAMVMFTPLAGGRPAAGRTNSQGRYELVFDRSGSGAMYGEHVVDIRTAGENVAEDGTVEMIEEKVPAKYNFQTELRADVQEGSNVFDFELESGGEVIQSEQELYTDEG